MGEAALCSRVLIRCIAIKYPSCCNHLRRPALYECSEAIAGSQQDSTFGGGLAERACVLSAHQPGECGHAALRRNPAEYVAMIRHEALEELEVSGGNLLGLAEHDVTFAD